MNAIDLILVQLEQAFRRKSWHGTNLLGSIRGIDIETAAWRPGKGRHNIWELIVHTAYWKYSVFRRFAGEPTPSFPFNGSNWFERSVQMGEHALRSDIVLLKEMHERLIGSIKPFPSDKLNDVPKGSKTKYIDLAVGVAAHDLYHAGQIQLIKRLRK